MEANQQQPIEDLDLVRFWLVFAQPAGGIGGLSPAPTETRQDRTSFHIERQTRRDHDRLEPPGQ
jgi:hypothetical protein